MVTQAPTVINKGRKDDEWFTAYRRWKGREVTRPVAEFGESVMYLPAASVGKNKLDVRWEDGAWLGIKMESRESIIGTRGVACEGQGLQEEARGGRKVEQ